MFALLPLAATAGACDLSVTVLGSGGPELDSERASSAYAVQVGGKVRWLVDTGPGAAQRYAASGAEPKNLRGVLLSHLHVDHSSDLPAFVKALYFTNRRDALLVAGPSGNQLLPGMNAFAARLFGDRDRGAWSYLSDHLPPDATAGWALDVREMPATGTEALKLEHENKAVRITAMPVHHGPIPALAWRIETAECAVVFTGDTSARGDALIGHSRGADLLIAHHAVPEDAGRVARNLHMTPSRIGEVAAAASVRRLVLSHRMLRTQGREVESLKHIRTHYSGPVVFADDGLHLTIEEH